MFPALYLDECVFLDTAKMLAARGIAVVTAQSVGMAAASDEVQLRFATANGWPLLSTTTRHFIRLHAIFQASDEHHAGIIAIPEGSHALRLAVRTAMMLDWIAAEYPSTQNRLRRWTDLQRRLNSGYILGGYTAEEISLALGRNAWVFACRSATYWPPSGRTTDLPEINLLRVIYAYYQVWSLMCRIRCGTWARSFIMGGPSPCDSSPVPQSLSP